MRHETPAFVKGDQVVKGQERGIVMELISRRNEPFLMVLITEGPRKHSREYPRHGWRAEINYPGGTVEQVCAICNREFKALDKIDVLCVTCGGRDLWAKANRARAARRLPIAAVGMHKAGAVEDDTQTCTACGGVLCSILEPYRGLVPPGPYPEGAFVQKGKGFQAMSLRVDAAVTCSTAERKTA